MARLEVYITFLVTIAYMLVGRTGQCPWKTAVVPHKSDQDPFQDTAWVGVARLM